MYSHDNVHGDSWEKQDVTEMDFFREMWGDEDGREKGGVERGMVWKEKLSGEREGVEKKSGVERKVEWRESWCGEKGVEKKRWNGEREEVQTERRSIEK